MSPVPLLLLLAGNAWPFHTMTLILCFLGKMATICHPLILEWLFVLFGFVVCGRRLWLSLRVSLSFFHSCLCDRSHQFSVEIEVGMENGGVG